VQFYPQTYFGLLSRRLFAQTASATETINNKPTMAIFSAGVALTATVLMATAGAKPALAIGFRLGCSVMNSAIGGAEGIRTPDLLLAKQALSRLSYSPNVDYCIKYCAVAKALSC
jgi:hypothetical protein